MNIPKNIRIRKVEPFMVLAKDCIYEHIHGNWRHYSLKNGILYIEPFSTTPVSHLMYLLSETEASDKLPKEYWIRDQELLHFMTCAVRIHSLWVTFYEGSVAADILKGFLERNVKWKKELGY